MDSGLPLSGYDNFKGGDAPLQGIAPGISENIFVLPASPRRGSPGA